MRKPEPTPAAIVVSTLQGLADFALSKHTGPDRGLFVLIDGPCEVTLRTGMFGDFNQRNILGVAKATVADFRFGVFYQPESFAVAVLSQFAADEERARLFGLTGTVESGSAIKAADDGVSQVVTTRKGINRAETKVDSMFRLRPFSTFSEVAQPARPFVLRMKPGNANAMPPEPHSCALFEADGGLWRIGATKAIKEFLAGELGDVVPVYG